MDALVTAIEVFFFSSRRRHTRSDRDWSSDVCSSDLLLAACAGAGQPASAPEASASSTAAASATVAPVQAVSSEYGRLTLKTAPRASCNAVIRVSAPSVAEAPPPVAGGIADQSAGRTATSPP